MNLKTVRISFVLSAMALATTIFSCTAQVNEPCDIGSGGNCGGELIGQDQEDINFARRLVELVDERQVSPPAPPKVVNAAGDENDYCIAHSYMGYNWYTCNNPNDLCCTEGSPFSVHVCRDVVFNDHDNCGSCGNNCGANHCSINTCCTTGKNQCGPGTDHTCYDLTNDKNHCGISCAVCPGSQFCSAGACACPAHSHIVTGSCACDTGYTNCNGVCTPSTTVHICGGACVPYDWQHCGEGTMATDCNACPNNTWSCPVYMGGPWHTCQ